MIKRASIEDLPKLEEIGNHFAKENKISDFKINIFINKWTHILKHKVGALWLAEQNHKIVGATGGMEYCDLWTDIICFTQIFWVLLPEYRGVNFLGLKLFSAFEQYAKNNNIKRIIVANMMTVNTDKMKKFYISLNYKPIEQYYMKEVI